MARCLAWFWAGMAFGVSFIATPVKFRASTLDIPTALEVGHVTFHALNRIEWLLVAVLAFAMARAHRFSGVATGGWIFFAAVATIVVSEAVLLLPALDRRTVEIMAGQHLPPSSLHGLFIGAEFAKMLILLLLGTRLGAPSPATRPSSETLGLGA